MTNNSARKTWVPAPARDGWTSRAYVRAIHGDRLTVLRIERDDHYRDRDDSFLPQHQAHRAKFFGRLNDSLYWLEGLSDREVDWLCELRCNLCERDAIQQDENIETEGDVEIVSGYFEYFEFIRLSCGDHCLMVAVDDWDFLEVVDIHASSREALAFFKYRAGFPELGCLCERGEDTTFCSCRRDDPRGSEPVH